jgi:hypothetical protein
MDKPLQVGQRPLDKKLGFRPGNENPVVDGYVQPIEWLIPHQVRHRLMAHPPAHLVLVTNDLLLGQLPSWVGVQPGLVNTQD